VGVLVHLLLDIFQLAGARVALSLQLGPLLRKVDSFPSHARLHCGVSHADWYLDDEARVEGVRDDVVLAELEVVVLLGDHLVVHRQARQLRE